MKLNRTASGILLVLALAALGYVMFAVPPKILEQYEVVSKMGTTWVYVYFGVVGTGAAILLGCSLWILWKLVGATWRKKKREVERSRNPSEMSEQQKQSEIDENLATVNELQGDMSADEKLRGELDPLIHNINEKRELQTLEIVAFGTISSGKSSLLNAVAGRDVFQTNVQGGTTTTRNEIPWPGVDSVVLVDTPGLGEVDGEEHVATAASAAKNADIVLVVVDGPLRHSEHTLLERLSKMEKHVLVCLNKDDWYEEDDRVKLLGQIAGQVADFVKVDDVISVRSRPTTRHRVRIMADGSEAEEAVEVTPDIDPLARRMMQIVKRNGKELLMANLLLQSRGLVEDAKQRVQDSLDKQAWNVVEKYTWAAAGAAALSPIPVLDLVSGAAISTKMVVDLSKVYRQDIALDTASTLLGQLGKQLIGFLGVSLAGPAIASGVGSLLKSVPGAGTIAGGLLQGIVQAVVTRWIGAVFVAYFKNEMQEPEGGLASLARREWQRVTSLNELRKIVVTARKKLTTAGDEEDDA